ncbi:ring canal kelch homolog isoform X2 [Rhopalosiphum padi]|uniref:ring canal kelch homolog isoform X2 n=1 Tax=Rhopalosiphum padi TaxID=40932 RepID=UPI00298E89C6|nr:ring canal kelch homolog isoform X2 [Rhopalosiphum padi]
MNIEMDAQTLLCEHNKKLVTKSNGCEPTNYRNKSHMVNVFKLFQSLRKNEVLCEIKLQTSDGKVVVGHKIVLVSASPYFHSIFTSLVSLDEYNKYIANIKELDSTALQLMVDYIYTGEINITEQNVQDLLPASNLLQLEFVKDASVEFLQKQLNPANCLGIRSLADLHNCMELLSSSEAYIKKQFLEVVKYDEFLSLSSEEVIKLISCNCLVIPFEEKVFECVINWVKHELDCRYNSLPRLIEHVRLPLISLEYITKEVVEEPLLKNSPECKNYVNEALHFHKLKTQQVITIPQTIRSTPRVFGHKVILVLCFSLTMKKYCLNWYDPVTKEWQIPIKINKRYSPCALALLKEHFVIILGDECGSKSVEMLDLSSNSYCWVSMVDMLVSRESLGVGVVDNCLYAIGGSDDVNILKSAEVFDVNIQEWKMISSMSTMRSDMGVGVIDNLLYVVGGYDGSLALKSVECYDPSTDTWTTIPEMSVRRFGPGVGVLNDELYVIGGHNGKKYQKSIETYQPSTGVWSFIADMHSYRFNPGVFTLNGLLYVLGGSHEFTYLDSLEIYNPKSNTWSIETLSKGAGEIFNGIVINRQPLFSTK